LRRWWRSSAILPARARFEQCVRDRDNTCRQFSQFTGSMALAAASSALPALAQHLS
jgi:hypothetical protein